jgi:hypothetical protein
VVDLRKKTLLNLDDTISIRDTFEKAVLQLGCILEIEMSKEASNEVFLKVILLMRKNKKQRSFKKPLILNPQLSSYRISRRLFLLKVITPFRVLCKAAEAYKLRRHLKVKISFIVNCFPQKCFCKTLCLFLSASWC